MARNAMKKTLILGALALAASTCAANARIVEISLDGTCNIYSIRFVDTVAVAVQDTPSCSGTYGGGVIAAVKNSGHAVVLALQDPSSPGVQWMLNVDYPFVNGGSFTLYQTTDGTRFTDALDGTYSLVGTPGMGAKTAKSVTAIAPH